MTIRSPMSPSLGFTLWMGFVASAFCGFLVALVVAHGTPFPLQAGFPMNAWTWVAIFMGAMIATVFKASFYAVILFQRS